MGTSRNNVTEISRFARERRVRGKTCAPLDDCREMSVLGLKKAFGESLDRAKDQLLPMAEKAVGQDLYNLYMDALELLRDHRGHGQRAISINAEALLDKLQNGGVRLLSDAPLMDRAVGSLMERLQQNAA